MPQVPMKLVAVLLFTAIALAVGPSFAGLKRISGAATSAALSANCASKGGSESGNTCTLPNGNVCVSTTLADSGKCVDENGVELPVTASEEATGASESSATSGDAPSQSNSGDQ